MSKPYYVTLTGGKNNAGDFLIKYRAFNLFKSLRPDRNIIDYNEWESIDNERLAIINQSVALILLGGPGLVYPMYPKIYPLRTDLDDIKVPIIIMGIGWKDAQGDWKDSYTYKLSAQSLNLLDRIEKSGYNSSVRDYHTLNVLQMHGYKNFIMTGCPAYYDKDYINKELKINSSKKVAFSLGVSFTNNTQMKEQMKEVILRLREQYNSLEVVFHHSLDEKVTEQVYGKKDREHYSKHKVFSLWLKNHNIPYIDISGSAENLISYYSKVDLHIGYRVHAHIFMNSISRYSILLNEDGRGKGVERVLGGTTINAYSKYKKDFFSKIFSRIFKNYNRMKPNKYVLNELCNLLDYESKREKQSIKRVRGLIDNNFETMKQFIQQLP